MVFEIIYAAGIVALAVAVWLALWISKQKVENKKMEEIAAAIREGARAYLFRQYKTISVIAVVLTVIFYYVLGAGTAWAFLLGALCSLLAGYVSMDVATRSNARTAYAARYGSDRSLRISFYGGLVMGLFNVGLSLLGVTTLFIVYGNNPTLIVGFGFGASLSALFAQLGGGIFTKAADVGADLVGKVEAGIPEDDPRNAAVIADNVGDNVGDVAGRGADLFESMTGENIGAMIIGFSLYAITRNFFFVIFPLLARSVGIFSSILAVPFVRMRGRKDPMVALRDGVIAAIIFAVIGFYILITYTIGDMNLYYASLVGLVASILIVLITEYYTSKAHKPVQEIAEASKTGHATNIIRGFAISLEATGMPVIVISIAILSAYALGTRFAAANGVGSFIGGIYGTAIATMGMLSIAGIILGLDGLGPIVDNAGGIAEMSHADKRVRNMMDLFDSTGNTTKALTKGYAMASAGLAALLLFQAYLQVTGVKLVDIVQPPILIGLFIGALLPFTFASFAITAVGRAAFDIVNEVRRQFREIKGLMEGKAKPDYSKAVDIATVAAQRGMIVPGLLPVVVPVIVGYLLGAAAVGALILGTTITGFLLAMQMNTGGAAWDNAKKYIEEGNLGGKGSEAHKAAVTGDTLGDPLKDTAGPSLHVLVKLINTASLTLAPLFMTHLFF